MKDKQSRREFLKFAGLTGVVFSTGLFPMLGRSSEGKVDEFYFVQFSDTHYGFNKKMINPDPVAGLEMAINKVNKLKEKPDFVMFTGDLTHSVDDVATRLQRMREFKEIISKLDVKNIRFIPGEHDAALDNGNAYREVFGEPYYSFVHKGINFVALDNVSNPRGIIGDEQLAWLDKTLATFDQGQPLVVFTHRPLFALKPEWDWATADGDKVIQRLHAFKHVKVFYGHIHQEHHHTTGQIEHHSARSLIFPLPAPGSATERKPLPWDANHPYQGLGVRNVEMYGPKAEIDEISVG